MQSNKRNILTIDDLMRKVNTEQMPIEYVDYWAVPDNNLVKYYIDNYGLRDKTKVFKADICNGCKVCQIAHVEKYKKNFPDNIKVSKEKLTIDPSGLPTHALQMNCPRIPNNYEDHLNGLSLTKEEQKALLMNMDPVAFAKEVFGWKPRAHQELALRCQSRKKIYRFGRRSGKTDVMAVEILYHAFTKIRDYFDEDLKETVRGVKILICCPYDSQVSEIFKRLIDLLTTKGSKLKGEYKYKQSPYHQITFANGAIISGFTAGTNGASAVRGQDAHVIILDEADYLKEKDFTTILPIAQSHPDCLIRVASTPSGLRSKFYEWCMTFPDWKEFYFPTPVIDETPFAETKMKWETLRREMRREYNLSGWLQEVMAIFIQNDTGVFAPSLVAKAMENYNYEQMVTAKQSGNLPFEYKYAMGVDWNSTHGTWIYISGFHPSLGIQIMEAVNVPKQNFTQLEGLNAITKLLQFWQPTYIYVDQGHGATNWESLKYWSSKQLPGTYEFTVQDKIKAYDFGSKVKIIEPSSGRVVEHPAKPFLVENTVKLFEDGHIKFSHEDELLKKQALNYIIKSRQQNGTPIYGQDSTSIGDHALDAFMLSLIGYTLEDSMLSLRRVSGENSINILESLSHLMQATREEKQEISKAKMTGAEIIALLAKEREEALARRENGPTPASRIKEETKHKVFKREDLNYAQRGGTFNGRYNNQEYSPASRIIK